jgi:hypothetical protein
MSEISARASLTQVCQGDDKLFIFTTAAAHHASEPKWGSAGLPSKNTKTLRKNNVTWRSRAVARKHEAGATMSINDWEAIFALLARDIPDPERRASLILELEPCQRFYLRVQGA